MFWSDRRFICRLPLLCPWRSTPSPTVISSAGSCCPTMDSWLRLKVGTPRGLSGITSLADLNGLMADGGPPLSILIWFYLQWWYMQNSHIGHRNCLQRIHVCKDHIKSCSLKIHVCSDYEHVMSTCLQRTRAWKEYTLAKSVKITWQSVIPIESLSSMPPLPDYTCHEGVPEPNDIRWEWKWACMFFPTLEGIGEEHACSSLCARWWREGTCAAPEAVLVIFPHSSLVVSHPRPPDQSTAVVVSMSHELCSLYKGQSGQMSICTHVAECWIHLRRAWEICMAFLIK